MADLLSKISVMLGKGNTPDAAEADPNAQPQTDVDEAKALAFTQDRWNDLKNSYVVIHQSIWQSLLFYANQSWIDWVRIVETTREKSGNLNSPPTNGFLARE